MEDKNNSELKTLKDFLPIEIKDYGDGQTSYTLQLLKQEAIKWVKWLELEDDYDKHSYTDEICLEHKIVDGCFGNSLGLSWEECSDIPAVIKFLKHFFNLTEEDLE